MKDWIKHIGAGFIIALFVGLPAFLDSGNLMAGIWPALTGGITASAIKEWCDYRTAYNGWSWQDFFWTCMGAVLAVVVILLIYVSKG